MNSLVPNKRRIVPRLSLPLFMGLMLALPLMACGSHRQSEANAQTNNVSLVGLARNAWALPGVPVPITFNARADTNINVRVGTTKGR